MDFRLLGPVEAWSEGRRLELGSRKQRFVLAVLALEVNRVVPVARLVDLTWGDAPPPTARTVIHTLVYRLRSALARGDGHRHGVQLDTEGSGYRLAADPLLVDVHRFRDLVARARDNGDDAARTALLDQALGLWRGPALSSAAPDSVRERMCAGLDEARTVATEDRMDAQLRLGRHHEVLEELTELAQAYPTRERLLGQLILALHRSGQTAHALSVSRETRRRLADELGLDPGPRLQELERAILRGDPSLDRLPAPGAAHIRDAPRDGTVRPAQLPADVVGFTGRASYLRRLDALLPDRADEPTVIAAIVGTAGVGKTVLAVHWAHRVAHRFPDGQVFVNLRGFNPADTVTAPAEAVRGFLEAFGVPPQRIPVDPEAQAGLYRSLLAGKRVLVVLDNARDADQVRPLLPGAPGCLAVVTSRDQITGLIAAEGAQAVTLDLLDVDEARQMLAARLSPDRVAEDPSAVGDIIASCGRLPLALAIAAARGTTHPTFPLSVLAAELRDGRPRLDSFASADAATDMRSVFSWSYHALSPGAARLFRLFGVQPGPHVTTPAAASLAGAPVPAARLLLAELAAAHLISEPLSGRFVIHDLLRAYAAELAHGGEDRDERRPALRRMLDHYLHTANAAATLLNPVRDPITLEPPDPGAAIDNPTTHTQAMDWFAAEHPVLLASIRRADACAEFDRHVIGLAWTLTVFLVRRGHWHDWAVTQRSALGAAQRLADRPAQAEVHRVLAAACDNLARGHEAELHFRHALDLFSELGDLAGQANTHLSLVQLFDRRNRHREALRHAEQALELFRAAEHRAGQARALNAVGYDHALLGDHERAIICCEGALTMHQELGDRFSEAATWDSLGYAHHNLGDHRRAILCYELALPLLRDVGDRYYETVCLTHLGDAQRAGGNSAAARKSWRSALTILEDLGHSDADGVRTKLGGRAR